MQEKSNIMSNNIYIERRDDGKYAVKREGAERASAITDTQKEAIERAKVISPDTRPDVERVRDTQIGRASCRERV